MSLELVLGGVLAAAVVVFVALPLLHPEALPPLEERPPEVVVAEERDRALAALRELEFDHRTGKITDEDYRMLVQPLRARAAQTLANNGASLSGETQETGPEQRFSVASLPTSRRDR